MIEAGRWVNLSGVEPKPRWSSRLIAFVLIVAVSVSLLGVKLFQLQVGQGSRLAALALDNRVHRQLLYADRGIIYDRHGVQLALNQPAWSLRVVPAGLPATAAARAEVLRQVALLSGRPETEIRDVLTKAPDFYAPVTVQEKLTAQQAQAVDERLPGLPGVELDSRPVRTYVDPADFGHVTGYTGRVDAADLARLASQGYQADQSLGKTGVEAGLEALLRGKDGWADQETDAQGQVVKTVRSQAPVPGQNVYLSIDANLQKAVASYLREGIRKVGQKAGAAIVVDPRTGELLALVSEPGFDANAFAGGISTAQYQKLVQDPAKPLYDRAVNGLYPPGSTFKMITAAAALEQGKINAASVLPCPAAIQYGGWTYHNWAGYDMGAMGVQKAIAVSCDTFFYRAADLVGDKTLAAYARAFGYGRAPSFEIPGASAGLVPDEDWLAANCTAGQDCRWNPGETLTMGIGQSYLLTTPLIQAMYVSAVANGGTLRNPTLVHQVQDAAGKVVARLPAAPVGQVPVSPGNLATVRQGMHDCLQAPYGTGFLFRNDKFKYDGGCKTGSAQFGGSGTDLPLDAWFTFFSPFDNPEIAIVVLVEGGGEGHDTAEPIAVKIADYYYANRDKIRA